MPLSADELKALDRKVGDLSREVAEIDSLLCSRYGETDQLAASARAAQKDFIDMANHLHSRAVAAQVKPGVTRRWRIA